MPIIASADGRLRPVDGRAPPLAGPGRDADAAIGGAFGAALRRGTSARS
jgi:hypothetical protein